MIGAHIINTSTEGWQIVREIRDTRASARSRTTGLGAPVLLADAGTDWAQAMYESSFPMARVVAGSDHYPVEESVRLNRSARAAAIEHINANLAPHIVANRLTRVLVLNEPRTYNRAEMRWLCEFLYYAAEHLYNFAINGKPFRVEAVLGNFAAGSPDGESEQWVEARRLVEACNRFGARIGLHDYFYRPPIMIQGGEWVASPEAIRLDAFAFRHRRIEQRFLGWGWLGARFAITECGFERHDNVEGSARWQETPISGENYARCMVLYASMVKWPVVVFTSGNDSGWKKHGLDGHNYTRAAIDAARTTAWLEETPLDASKPPTPRHPYALLGFYNNARTLQVRYSPGGDVKETLVGRLHWVDIFEIRDGYWRLTDFRGERPDWWVREFPLQPQ